MKTLLMACVAALPLVSGAAFAETIETTTTRTVAPPAVVVRPVAPRAVYGDTTTRSHTTYRTVGGVEQQKTVTHEVGPTATTRTTTTTGY